METAKTLWLLDYGDSQLSRLVVIYAEDEDGAWREATSWAMKNDILLPSTARLIHYSCGFRVHTSELPGTIK